MLSVLHWASDRDRGPRKLNAKPHEFGSRLAVETLKNPAR
jgi:hypothetical protein